MGVRQKSLTGLGPTFRRRLKPEGQGSYEPSPGKGRRAAAPRGPPRSPPARPPAPGAQPPPAAPVPVVHVGPVLPLLHDPARVPLAPLGHGGASGADDEGRGSGYARVSGLKVCELHARRSQKVPEVPAPDRSVCRLPHPLLPAARSLPPAPPRIDSAP